jgi:hypothetical protein
LKYADVGTAIGKFRPGILQTKEIRLRVQAFYVDQHGSMQYPPRASGQRVRTLLASIADGARSRISVPTRTRRQASEDILAVVD